MSFYARGDPLLWFRHSDVAKSELPLAETEILKWHVGVESRPFMMCPQGVGDLKEGGQGCRNIII